MQFRVPQNIDLEDKIVGPLTIVQLIYVIVGGLIVYSLYQALSTNTVAFVLLALPIAIVTLSMAFLKIQDQPVSHFITAGIAYLSRPKIRFWQRSGYDQKIVDETIVSVVKVAPQPIKKDIEQSDLEQLAYVLDTRPIDAQEEKYFGKITSNFEKILQQTPQFRTAQAPPINSKLAQQQNMQQPQDNQQLPNNNLQQIQQTNTQPQNNITPQQQIPPASHASQQGVAGRQNQGGSIGTMGQ